MQKVCQEARMVKIKQRIEMDCNGILKSCCQTPFQVLDNL